MVLHVEDIMDKETALEIMNFASDAKPSKKEIQTHYNQLLIKHHQSLDSVENRVMTFQQLKQLHEANKCLVAFSKGKKHTASKLVKSSLFTITETPELVDNVQLLAIKKILGAVNLTVPAGHELCEFDAEEIGRLYKGINFLFNHKLLDEEACNYCFQNPLKAIQFARDEIEKNRQLKVIDEILLKEQLILPSILPPMSTDNINHIFEALTIFSKRNILDQDKCDRCFQAPEATHELAGRCEIIASYLQRARVPFPNISHLLIDDLETLETKIGQLSRNKTLNQASCDNCVNNVFNATAPNNTNTFKDKYQDKKGNGILIGSIDEQCSVPRS